jgi:hypothetical protein
MVAMRCRAALAVSLALAFAFAACTKESPSMPSTCIDTDRAGYEHALTAAPGDVALPGGVTISTCTERVRTDAELQNLGSIVHSVAEELAARAKGADGAVGDADAALRLGYLSGAISAGAAKSNGIAAELARRVQTTTVVLVDAPRRVQRSLRTGAAAGAARG